MSKIGLVEVSGIKKPIKLEGINTVQVNFNSIGIQYSASSSGNQQWGSSSVFIQFRTPLDEMPQDFIRSQFHKWLSDGLVLPSPPSLNEYLPQIEITDVGIKGDITTGKIQAAGDLESACLATPTTEIALDFTGGGTPLIGTYVFNPSKNGNGLPGPVDPGTYALEMGIIKYFITVNKSSLISFIEICPTLLDFIYSLKDLGSGLGRIEEGNPNAISFSIADRNIREPVFGEKAAEYYGYPEGTELEPRGSNACAGLHPERIFGDLNGMWPVGTLNNATENKPDFNLSDVTFALKLADPNVSSMQDAEIFISFNYNSAGNEASWIPFTPGTNSLVPAFPTSPKGGVPGFGNGATDFVEGGDALQFSRRWRGTVYFPPGDSLIGSASFSQGGFWYFDSRQGKTIFPDTVPCLN